MCSEEGCEKIAYEGAEYSSYPSCDPICRTHMAELFVRKVEELRRAPIDVIPSVLFPGENIVEYNNDMDEDTKENLVRWAAICDMFGMRSSKIVSSFIDLASQDHFIDSSILNYRNLITFHIISVSML